MKLSASKTLWLAGCSLAVLATPAFAQEQEEQNVIVVTAQNRAQDVQDVPIAMEVLTGEELSSAGFSNANDLGRVAPAVQINQDQGTVKISVRGVGTNSLDEAQDTSVVANIDGEYINRPNVLGVALFDLERVEVLRGPQGTLYGRNSTGGAINFVTRKPGDDFGLNASISYGNYDALRMDAGIDIPVADMGGVRFSGFYEERDGYVNHPAGGGFFVFPAYEAGTSDDNQALGGRVSLALESGGLSFNIAAEYAERDFRPQVFAAGDLNAAGNGPTGPGCNADGFEAVAPAYAPLVLCTPSQTSLLDNVDRSEYAAPNYGLGSGISQETWAVRGRIAYEFSPAATLSYTAGYRGFSQGDLAGNEFVTLPVIYRSYNFLDDVNTQSHELRLNGELDNGIVYQVGGFYFRETQLVESGFLLPSFIFGQAPSAPGTFLSYFGRDVVSDSISAFGQVEVPLGETLTAIGGLRYTDNSRSAVYQNASPFGAGPPDMGLIAAGSGRKDFDTLAYATTLNLGSNDDKITWLAGLNYEPNDDMLLFAKVTTGFKGGGFDSVGTYGPETNTAYEIGGKFEFGSFGQHRLNLGAFYYDYSGLQVSVLLDTTVGGQTFNAGAATIWGLEAEGTIALGENTFFNASVNYLDATYDELLAQFNVFCVGCDINGIGDLDPNEPGVQQPNFAGNRAPFSPEWIIAAGLEHTFDMGSAGSLTASANTTFKSSYFTDFYNYNDGRQGSYTQTDLLLDWRSASDTFGIQLFARNLENERPLTYGSFTSAGPDDIFNWQFGAPRTYGIRLLVDY